MNTASDDPRSPSTSAPFLRIATSISLAIPVILAVLLSWHSLGDADIWLHDRVGRDLLAGRGAPSQADLSFSDTDRRWHNHEPLFQVLVALTGPGDGATPPEVRGWNVLRTILGAGIMLLLALGDGRWRRVRSGDGPGPGATWWAAPLLVGLLLLWPRLILRPELLSFVFFVLAIRGIEGALRSRPAGHWSAWIDPRRSFGALFWLTVVWAWSHGFAAMMPVLWLVGGILARLQNRLPGYRAGRKNSDTYASGTIGAGRWAIGLLLLLGALALTPGGPAGIVYPLRALGQFGGETVDLRRVISELAPLLETRNTLHWTLLAFRVSLVWAAIWIVVSWGRVSLLRIVLFVLTAVAAVLAQRNLGFYALAFCLLHTGAAPGSRDDGWRLGPLRRIAVPGPLIGASGLLLVLGAATGWGLLLAGDGFYLREGVGRRFGGGMTPAQYAFASVDDLRERSSERVFANLAATALVLDRTSAHLFIDGRTEAYRPARWNEYLAVRRGGDSALRQLARMKVDAVLVGGGGRAFSGLTTDLRASGRWRLERAEEAGWLFGRAGGGHTAAADSATLRSQAAAAEAALLPLEHTLRPARFADRSLAVSRLWKKAGAMERSEAMLRRGLQARPDHPTLLHNLGNLLLEKKRYPAAEDCFSQALAMNPALAGSALNLGVCLMSEHRPEEAAKAFARATRIDPDLFEAWANLAMALEQTGRRGEAVRALERAVALRPNDRQLRRMLDQRRR